MRALTLVCVVLLSSGCLVEGNLRQEDKGEQEREVKINVDGEEDTSIPWSECEKLLTKKN